MKESQILNLKDIMTFHSSFDCGPSFHSGPTLRTNGGEKRKIKIYYKRAVHPERSCEAAKSKDQAIHRVIGLLRDLVFIAVSFLLFLPSPLLANKNPVPRFVSLKSNEINQRVGPGPNYPVEWTYVKAGLPVEVIAEFDNWRKIRDKDGTEGWVHQSMLSSKRHGIIQTAESLMYASEDLNSRPLARLEPGVLVEILKCRENWCQVRVVDFKGWIPRPFVWGLYSHEIIG